MFNINILKFTIFFLYVTQTNKRKLVPLKINKNEINMCYMYKFDYSISLNRKKIFVPLFIIFLLCVYMVLRLYTKYIKKIICNYLNIYNQNKKTENTFFS